MIEKLIDEEMCEKIDFNNVKNFEKVDKELKDQIKILKTNIPYAWGTMGVLYNKNMVSEKLIHGIFCGMKNIVEKFYMLESSKDNAIITLKKLDIPLTQEMKKS